MIAEIISSLAFFLVGLIAGYIIYGKAYKTGYDRAKSETQYFNAKCPFCGEDSLLIVTPEDRTDAESIREQIRRFRAKFNEVK